MRIFGIMREFYKRHGLLCRLFLSVILSIPVLLFVWLVLCPMDTRFYLGVPASPQMLDRNGCLLFPFLNEQEQWCFERDISEINPHLINATIAVEDRHFRSHPGVNILAVGRAALQNITERRIASGASTITMQVVKISRGMKRSLTGKMLQAALALRLDMRASKDEILQAYLNKAPYGLNLVGCEAAARRYWGKSSKELTLSESALLAGLPRAPSALNPLKYPERARRRRNFVLLKMLEARFISPSEYRNAVEKPLGAAWCAFPQDAPHLAMKMRGEIEDHGSLRTTLSAEIQGRTEHLLRDHLKGMTSGLNGAVIVIDVPSAEILGRAGSADYFSKQTGSRVDCCASPRSPGSALKPFIYAIAMERSKLYASEILRDSPVDFGLYTPENFNKTFTGVVTATDALRGSLNIPAISVLNRIGPEKALIFFRQAGIGTLNKPAEHYGLGLALGDCEVRLDELAAAYLMIAGLGNYRPLRIVRMPGDPVERRLLSRGVCMKMFEMLESPAPAEFARIPYNAAVFAPRFCWKTGTSSDRCDAWAFVFNRHYVVGVWMGRIEGGPARELVGAEAALPLALRIFHSLKTKDFPEIPEPSDDLCPIRICAQSGLPATASCPGTMESLIPRTQSIARRCRMDHRLTQGVASREGIKILFPVRGSEFILTGEADGDRIHPSTTMDQTDEIHWYQNGRYLGKSTKESNMTLTLSEGEFTLSCMAATGSVATTEYKVLCTSR